MDKKKTILVVEDERPLLEAIKLKLESKGMSVVNARTVEQALSYLEDLETVDAIWLDHFLLGKEDGLDLVAKLKSEGSYHKDLPIFVVSNTASDEKVSSYLHFGVDKYFVKSDYRLEQIADYIGSVLENGESK